MFVVSSDKKALQTILVLLTLLTAQCQSTVAQDVPLTQTEVFRAIALTSAAFRSATEKIQPALVTIESFGGAGTLEVHTLTDHEQFSQEFQLTGSHERLNYVAGLYYFEESGSQRESQYLDRAAVDNFGVLAFDFITNAPCSDGRDGAPMCTDLGFTFPNFLGEYTINTDVESLSAFGQATWTPNVLEDNLDLTLGLRYTDDKRDAQRTFDAWLFNAFIPPYSDAQVRSSLAEASQAYIPHNQTLISQRSPETSRGRRIPASPVCRFHTDCKDPYIGFPLPFLGTKHFHQRLQSPEIPAHPH